MQLSKRLEALANTVTKGSRVADIGCDHAYVSIYLMENKIAEHVIAMDINRGPLERANSNIALHGLSDKIETRLSDGAKKLNQGEVDAVLIAGMGGALMVKILSERFSVIKECKELILQPQSEIFLVRKFLHEQGFRIDSEQMMIDEGKYYTILRAVPGKECYNSEVQYLYGKCLLEKKDSCLKQFLLHQLEKKNAILERLEQANATARMEEIRKEIEYITEGVTYYDL